MRLKNMSAGSFSVFNCPQHALLATVSESPKGEGHCGRTSMKTVPFWLGPLQYCAGKVLLLVQSG